MQELKMDSNIIEKQNITVSAPQKKKRRLWLWILVGGVAIGVIWGLLSPTEQGDGLNGTWVHEVVTPVGWNRHEIVFRGNTFVWAISDSDLTLDYFHSGTFSILNNRIELTTTESYGRPSESMVSDLGIPDEPIPIETAPIIIWSFHRNDSNIIIINELQFNRR